jgi:hypothetical protein
VWTAVEPFACGSELLSEKSALAFLLHRKSNWFLYFDV